MQADLLSRTKKITWHICWSWLQFHGELTIFSCICKVGILGWGDWNLSELEFVRIPFLLKIGICQNLNLSEFEFVRIGICQNWNLSELKF